MAEEKPEQAQEKAARGKKINKMTLAEVEKQLQEIKSSQGGYTSRYAKELRRRKSILQSSKA
ncbi:MAG: hypothetical protein A2W03_01690 [Candidatus Aminicenantes bacterium RBG_16_63_16]|nr:MAG: hypothetical protein A2W03_01690 [Candidatus Aminicenantes bacterium RBG_16_63_16]